MSVDTTVPDSGDLFDTVAYIGGKPERSKFNPVENDSFAVKPKGGFWTSPLRDDGRFGWLDWTEREMRLPEEFDVWECHPEDELTVATIDTYQDLIAYLDVYERNDHFRAHSSQAALDFEEMATVYDAIYLTENGQRETRLTSPNLYGWDCETVLWLDWRFDTVEHLGTVGDYYDT